MSRSYKAPYVGQKQDKKDKRLAARRVRYKAKSPEEAIADGKSFRKESNPWDIKDWSFYSDDAKTKRK